MTAWRVWAKPHPAENAPGWRVIGNHRWKSVARLQAWWYEFREFDHMAVVVPVQSRDAVKTSVFPPHTH